jgi:hypothetical protein
MTHHWQLRLHLWLAQVLLYVILCYICLEDQDNPTNISLLKALG